MTVQIHNTLPKDRSQLLFLYPEDLQGAFISFPYDHSSIQELGDTWMEAIEEKMVANFKS